jgi:hypothetical protein
MAGHFARMGGSGCYFSSFFRRWFGLSPFASASSGLSISIGIERTNLDGRNEERYINRVSIKNLG